MEHYSCACGSFFSSNSHVSFFLSGNHCVIPPMCDCAWRFLPSGVWDLGASDPSWEILVLLSKKITSKNSIMNVCCMVSIPSSLMRYVALFFFIFPWCVPPPDLLTLQPSYFLAKWYPSYMEYVATLIWNAWLSLKNLVYFILKVSQWQPRSS